MKREILFRGKRVDNGEWVYGDIVHLGLPKILPQISTHEIPDGFLVIPETVGQYTGITDKNGTKIFEGHIVRYDNYTIAKVIFKSGGFCGYDGYALSSNEAYLKIDPENCPIEGNEFTVQVIGSIHDNPDLLK